jgi:dTDP-4-amino-4,6-dideoxygalactose transaminase
MESEVNLIAILGGAPSFLIPLHVGGPNIGDRDVLLGRIHGILDRRWLTNGGPLVEEFEASIAQFVGVKHCVSMCNATVALEIAIRALQLSGEVIVPSYTFIATAHALQWQEITPIFADINRHTSNIDPASIEPLITSRTSGILGVHLWGRACETEAIDAIASAHGLQVMYDASHAFGCSHQGKMIGGFGLCEVFSFHATKLMNSFEGGAVVTNDNDLAEKMRLMRNFGFSGYDNVSYLGVNGKMTEVCAAMGLTSLDAIDEIIAINHRNYLAYRMGLQDLPGVTVITYGERERNNYQYIVVEVDTQHSPLNRDEIVAVLHAENVLARRYFWPGCRRMEPYRSLQPKAYLDLFETERVASKNLLLPTGQAITTEHVEVICNIIQSAFMQANHVRHTLSMKQLS